MFGDFFGEFLLKQGVITPEQLDEAIQYQKELNSLLGSLAVEKGYLNAFQVNSIIIEQRTAHKKFGQLAIERGLLTQDQLRDLLHDQSENHILLGEALVRLRYLTIESLNVHLNNFKAHLTTDEAGIQLWLRRLSHPDIVQTALNVIVEYFYRLGYVLKVKGVEGTSSVSPYDPVFLADQDFSQTSRAVIGLQMPWSVVRVVIRDTAFDQGEPSSKLEEFEQMIEVIRTLNDVVCQELHRQGYAVTPGSVRFELPKQTDGSVKIGFRSMLGPIYLLYYPQVPGPPSRHS